MSDWPIGELFDQDYLEFYAPLLVDETSDADVEAIWSLLGLAEGPKFSTCAAGTGASRTGSRDMGPT